MKKLILLLVVFTTIGVYGQTPTVFNNRVQFKNVPKFNPSSTTNKVLRNLQIDKDGMLVWFDIPKDTTGGGGDTIVDASATQRGLVNNISLQELGGKDKLINGIRIGKGNNSIATNTAVGSSVLSAITTGNNNAGFGTGALIAATTANANSAFGAYALYTNSTGINNSAFGNFALQNTTAANNAAFGYGAGAANTTGTRNTWVGAGVGILSTTANNNTFIGAAAGQNNTTGSSNIFLGWMAGANTSTGAGNVIIGTQATTGTGISTGSNNLIIGPNAGNGTGITTGNGNVVVGKVTGLTANSTNTVNIADGAGNMMLQKNINGEVLLPNVTNSLITSGGNKAIVTKEFLDTTIASLPTPSIPSFQDVLDEGSLTVVAPENLFLRRIFSGPDIMSALNLFDGGVGLGVSRPSTSSETSVNLSEQNVSVSATGNFNIDADTGTEFTVPQVTIKNNTTSESRFNYSANNWIYTMVDDTGDDSIVINGGTGEGYFKGGVFSPGYLNVEGLTTLEGSVDFRANGSDEGIEIRRSGSSYTVEFLDNTATPRLTLDNDGYVGTFSITTNNLFITEPGAGTLEIASDNLVGNKIRTLANSTGTELLTINGAGANTVGNIDLVAYYASATALTNATLNSTYPDVPIGFRVLAPNVGTSMIYTKVTEAGTSDVWLSQATSIVP